jgi:hypothetical protein
MDDQAFGQRGFTGILAADDAHEDHGRASERQPL